MAFLDAKLQSCEEAQYTPGDQMDVWMLTISTDGQIWVREPLNFPSWPQEVGKPLQVPARQLFTNLHTHCRCYLVFFLAIDLNRRAHLWIWWLTEYRMHLQLNLLQQTLEQILDFGKWLKVWVKKINLRAFLCLVTQFNFYTIPSGVGCCYPYFIKVAYLGWWPKGFLPRAVQESKNQRGRNHQRGQRTDFHWVLNHRTPNTWVCTLGGGVGTW